MSYILMETMPGPRYVQHGQFVIRYVAFCAIFYFTCTYYIRMPPKKRKQKGISRQPCMQKRAPNATLLNIAAKIKCTKNRIIQHLMAMDDQERSATITRTIVISSSIKIRSKQYVRDMHNEIIRRVKEKLTVREKKIRQAIKGGADVTAALECPDKLYESIMKILNNDIVDHYIDGIMKMWN